MSIAKDRGMDSGKEFEKAGRDWFKLLPRAPGLERKAMRVTSG